MKAKNEQEVRTQKAISDLATKLQEAKTKQDVKNAEMAVKIEERKRLIEIQGTFFLMLRSFKTLFQSKRSSDERKNSTLE
jgi:hypothetical protein